MRVPASPSRLASVQHRLSLAGHTHTVLPENSLRAANCQQHLIASAAAATCLVSLPLTRQLVLPPAPQTLCLAAQPVIRSDSHCCV